MGSTMSHTFVYVASALFFDDRFCLILVFFRSEDKNARSGQVAPPKNSGAPPLGRTLLKHLYKYLKI